MWMPALVVPALNLMVQGAAPQSPSGIDAKCREGSPSACVELATDLAEEDPGRATALYRSACVAGHLEACREACLAGEEQGCLQLGYPPPLSEALRRIHDMVDPGARVRAIRSAGDPALLGALAWALQDEPSRQAAIAQLASLVLESLPEGERREHLENLAGDADDQRAAAVRGVAEPLAAAVALTDPSATVRAAALRGVSDATLLLWIVRSESDIHVASQALGRLGSPATLRRLAMASDLLQPQLGDRVGVEAVRLLHGAQVVLPIARAETAPPRVRATAIARIHDAVVLRDLAWREGPLEVQTAAVNRLEAADLLPIARAHPLASVRLLVVSRFAGQGGVEPLDAGTLSGIARDDPSAAVRREAVRWLRDQGSLLDLVTSAPDGDVRVAAAEKLTDPAALARVARTHSDADIRAIAAGRVGDPTILVALAGEDADPGVRRAAVERLASGVVRPRGEAEAALRELAKTSPYGGVRVSAAAGLRDASMLRRLARDDSDPEVRSQARWLLGLIEYDAARSSGGQVLIGAQYGSQGPTASFGIVAGRLDRAFSHTVPAPDSIAGVLVQGEVGPRALKASLGVAGAAALMPMLSTGAAAKLSYLKRLPSGGRSEADYVGIEVDVWLLAKLSVGLFRSLEPGGGFRATWGIGLGL